MVGCAMAGKENPIKTLQEYLDHCKAEVDYKRAELARYENHYDALMQFFSQSPPAFPEGNLPEDGLSKPDSTDDSVAERLDMVAEPSGKVSEVTESEEETSSQSTSSTSSGQQGGRLSHTLLASEKPLERTTNLNSSDSESSDSLKRSPKSSKVKPKLPAVKWTERICKPTRKTADRESSTDSEDSISSEEPPVNSSSQKDILKDVEKTRSSGDASQSGKHATAEAGSQKTAIEVSDWTTDATPEDLFDWKVLGLSGPWTAGSSPTLLAESSWSQLKARNSMPVMFPSVEEYRSHFERLIIEECKAVLLSCWEAFTSRSGGGPEVTENPGSMNNSMQSSLWQFNAMLSIPGDPFNWYEAKAVQPPSAPFDTSDVLVLTHNDTTALAIVNLTDRKQILLKTRTKLQATNGQFTLVPLTGMIPSQRQYVSLAKTSEIWNPLLRQVLGPEESRTALIASSNDDDLKIDSLVGTILTWSKLDIFNTRQLLTLNSLLQLKQGFMLVQGPPGTGKTSAIVGMVSAVLIDEPGARILVCASSNAAVDEVVTRLMNAMIRKDGSSYAPERGKLVRVGVRQSIQPACFPVWLDNIHDRKGTIGRRTDTLKEASIVCSTITGCGHSIFDEANLKFDLLIIDEAAQVQETELLIALRRVRGRCVMVGDPRQLPAVVLQKPGEAFGRSLFERMQEAGVPVIMMTTQYRMHPQISKFPSENFYRGLLKDSAQCQSRPHIFMETANEQGVDVRGHNFRLGPYVFLDVTWGMEQGERFSHSLLNAEEAEVVAAVVQGVVKSLREGVQPNIGVITPYLAQRAVITGNLERQGLDERSCEVNTVDGFQGREKDVIILSCVRAQSDKGIGFVSDRRRLNVALTRARYCLIIVGHSQTLRKQSNVWDDLVMDASSRGLYQIIGKGSQAERWTNAGQRSGQSQRAFLSTLDSRQRRDERNLDQQGVLADGRHTDDTAKVGPSKANAPTARVNNGGPESAQKPHHQMREQAHRALGKAQQKPKQRNFDRDTSASRQANYHPKDRIEMRREEKKSQFPPARFEDEARENLDSTHAPAKSGRHHAEGHAWSEGNEDISRQRSERNDNKSWRRPTYKRRQDNSQGGNKPGKGPKNFVPKISTPGSKRRFEHGGESVKRKPNWKRPRNS